MKTVVYTKYGSPEVLTLKDTAIPVPKDDEVLINVHATTVLASDCELRRFDFPLWFWLPLRLYMGIIKPTRVNVLGQEFAGEVTSVGKKVTRFAIGDQVFAQADLMYGAYAEYICLPDTSAMVTKPKNMSYEEAACVPTGGLNALHYVRKAKIQRGDKVLVIGASGNIGSFAVQLAKYYGAEVTGVESGDKLDMLRLLGVDKVIDYKKESFSNSGETYDVIIDVVCSALYADILKSLNENGRYMLVNPRLLSMARGLWTSATSRKKVMFEFSKYKSDDLIFLRKLIEEEKLKSVIDRSYPLEEIVEAHRYVETGNRKGNIAITLSGKQ